MTSSTTYDFCIVPTMYSTYTLSTANKWHCCNCMYLTLHPLTDINYTHKSLALLHIVLVLMNCLLVNWLTLLMIYPTLLSSYSSAIIDWWTQVPTLELTRTTCITSRAPRQNHLLMLPHVTARDTALHDVWSCHYYTTLHAWLAWHALMWYF